MTPPIPAKFVETVALLAEHCWTFQVRHLSDSVGHVYINVIAQKSPDTPQLYATWHTRPTNGERYRWDGGMYRGRAVTLSKLTSIITEETS